MKMEDSHILNSTHWTLTPATSAQEIGLKELNFHLPKALIPMPGCYCCLVLSVRSRRLVASPVSQFIMLPSYPLLPQVTFTTTQYVLAISQFRKHMCAVLPVCILFPGADCGSRWHAPPPQKDAPTIVIFGTPSFQDHQPLCRPFWDSCRVSQPPPCFTEIPQTSILTRWKRSLPFIHASQVSDLRGRSENFCKMKEKSDRQLLSQANPLLGVGSWGRQKKISACILVGWQMSLDIPSENKSAFN